MKVGKKGAECPNLVPQLGIAGPIGCTGESQRQASNPIYEVVEVGPGADVGYPLRSAESINKRATSPRHLTGVMTTRPKGLMEVVLVEISSTVRIRS